MLEAVLLLVAASRKPRLVHIGLYAALSIAAIATMVNAPGIFYGYDLVFSSMVYASWAFPPLLAAALFGLSHAAALALMLLSKSIFTIVALASLLLRTPFVYIASRIREKSGVFASSVFLGAADTGIALSIAILYYGNDGMHVGLAVYELLLLPFTYMVYASSREANTLARVLGATGGLLGLFAYTASLYAFFSPLGLLGSILTLTLLGAYHARRSALSPPLGLIVLIIAVLAPALGLAIGGRPAQYNLKAMLYPFEPQSWSEQRWAQNSPDCPATLNVFSKTHGPERLRIIEPCATVTGIVVGAPFIADDGDYCFDLEVDPEYRYMLGVGNMLLRKGRLHVEIVPGDHERILLGELKGGVCPGDKVKVTGVLVVDTDHGMWVEIHPVIRASILERKSSKPWPLCITGRVDWAEAGE